MPKKRKKKNKSKAMLEVKLKVKNRVATENSCKDSKEILPQRSRGKDKLMTQRQLLYH
jgi:hypothetical protein